MLRTVQATRYVLPLREGGSLSQRERFHWLTSPRRTIAQLSPVHTGVCDETDTLLDRMEEQFLVS